MTLSRVAPFFLLFASLAVQRRMMISDLGLGHLSLLERDVLIGYFYDACILMLPAAFARIAWGLFAIPRFWTWAALSALLWGISQANVMYMRFFSDPLDLWVVKNHWSETFAVRGSISELSANLPMMMSILLLAAALYAAWGIHRREAGASAPPPGVARFSKRAALSRLRPVASGIMMAAGILLLRQSPVWFRIVSPNAHSMGNVLHRQVHLAWFNEAIGSSHGSGSRRAIVAEGTATLNILARFREFREGAPIPQAAEPLHSRLDPDADSTRALRKRLGLPESGPVNILVVFLESVRALEMQHPEIGPRIFPRLSKHLQTRGFQFTTAYSSAFNAGLTVRGEFMTLCSMFDNMLGPAAYISFNRVSVKCVQQYLRDGGYTTAWFNSHDKHFQNKSLFESLHGMQHFFDHAYFSGLGISETFNQWGLADRPVLKETLRKYLELASEGRPIFAHALTVSTHPPFPRIEEDKVDRELWEATKSVPYYQNYLSTLRYTDDNISDLLEGLFASPIGDRTVVFMLGDHSTRVPPHFSLSPVQENEYRFRVPLVIFTKKPPKPEKISYAVHQIDVAPTIAQISGVAGAHTWMGRGLFSGEGSPWIHLNDGHLTYRTKTRGCYSDRAHPKLACFDLSGGVDPLYVPELKPVRVDPAQSTFFRSVAEAASKAIELDLFAETRALSQAPTAKPE